MFQACDTICTPCAREMPYFHHTVVAIENQVSVLLHFLRFVNASRETQAQHFIILL